MMIIKLSNAIKYDESIHALKITENCKYNALDLSNQVTTQLLIDEDMLNIEKEKDEDRLPPFPERASGNA